MSHNSFSQTQMPNYLRHAALERDLRGTTPFFEGTLRRPSIAIAIMPRTATAVVMIFAAVSHGVTTRTTTTATTSTAVGTIQLLMILIYSS